MANKSKLNVKRARKILGKLAENLPDEQIEHDIEVAEVIKNLFFHTYTTAKKLPSIYNENNHGKT